MHLPGYMNKMAELPFPHMIWFSCFCGVSSAQVFTVTVSVSLRFYAGVLFYCSWVCFNFGFLSSG